MACNASLNSHTCVQHYVSSVASTPVSEETSDLQDLSYSSDCKCRTPKRVDMKAGEIKSTLINMQKDFDDKFAHLLKEYGVK